MEECLRVGLIVDDDKIPQHVTDLIEWASEQPTISVSLLVVQQQESNEPGDSRGSKASSSKWRLNPVTDGILWRIVNIIEQRRLRVSKFPGALYTSIDIGEAGRNKIRIHRLSLASEPGRSFREVCAAAIGNDNYDLLVQCGTLSKAADFAGCAKLGIIEVHFGDDLEFRGSPPGFWEVLFKRDKTGFSIRHLERGPDSWQIVARGSFPTQGYYLLNRAALLSRSNRHLKLLLTRASISGELPAVQRSLPYSGAALGNPQLVDVVRYVAVLAARMLTSKAKSVIGLQERWGISFTRKAWPNAELSQGIHIENPRGRFFADPFLITAENETFCFVEDYLDDKGKGVISVLTIDNSGPSFVGRAIEEDFHLSFPYMFEYMDQLFMCPESHQAGQIRIYRCKAFPLEWELHSIAMEGVSAVDTMIFASGDRWWMLTNIDAAPGSETFSELHLFSAPDPLSAGWVPHPMNPIIVDPEFARNAGILRDGSALFRVSQARAFGSYGVSASIFEIKQLDSTSYREERVTTLQPKFKRGLSGLHHFHSAGEYSVWDHKSWERTR